MNCPLCKTRNLQTRMECKDTRSDSEGTIRRYKCPKCKMQIWTKSVIISKAEYDKRYNAILKRLKK